jgi:hypothetical protein
MRTKQTPIPERELAEADLWFIVPFDQKDLYGQHGVGSTYAVSNWHVVSFAPTIRLTTAGGEIDVIAASTEQWIRHPDGQTDLAVLPLQLERGKPRIAALAPGHIVTHEKARESSIGIGDDVFMVGRFINHEGVQRNRPTVRFGAIAQMPGDKIPTDAGEQDAYLAEIRSISGDSGSLVIVLIPADRAPGFESLKLSLTSSGRRARKNWTAPGRTSGTGGGICFRREDRRADQQSISASRQR